MFYLLLVYNSITPSVMVTSDLVKLDFRHSIPTSSIGKLDVMASSVMPTYSSPLEMCARARLTVGPSPSSSS